MGVKIGVGIAKAGYGAVREVVEKIFKPKSSPVISSVKPAKNLTGRRKDRDDIVKGVDKHLDSSDPKSSKIKKKYTDKASAIYDKLDKKK